MYVAIENHHALRTEMTILTQGKESLIG